MKKVVYKSNGTVSEGRSSMDDNEIINLYWQRNGQAIKETADKYGIYCFKISLNILGDMSDSEENVNDTYMKTWSSIPPNRPNSLKAYLAKITRNLALNRYKASHTQKRYASEFAVSLDELDICISSKSAVEDEAEISALGRCISDFLYMQKQDVRNVFVCRYFYCDSIDDIASRFGYSRSKIKSMLMRTRTRLKSYLEKEGYLEE